MTWRQQLEDEYRGGLLTEFEVEYLGSHGDLIQTRRYRRLSIADALATASVQVLRGELRDAATVTVRSPKVS